MSSRIPPGWSSSTSTAPCSSPPARAAGRSSPPSARRSTTPARSRASGSTARPIPRSWPRCWRRRARRNRVRLGPGPRRLPSLPRAAGDRAGASRRRARRSCPACNRCSTGWRPAPASCWGCSPGIWPRARRSSSGRVASTPSRFRVGAYGSDAAAPPGAPRDRGAPSRAVLRPDSPGPGGRHHRRHARGHPLRRGDLGAGAGRRHRLLLGERPRRVRAACGVRGPVGHRARAGGHPSVRPADPPPRHRELELKAVVPDPGAFRRRLRAAGAVPRFHRPDDRSPLRSRRGAHLPRRGAAGPDLPPSRRQSRRSWPGRDPRCARPRATSCGRRSSSRSPGPPPTPGRSSSRWATGRCTPSSGRWRSIGWATRPRDWRPTPAWTCCSRSKGTPAAIERAIAASGIPRSEFTAESLAEFVRRFEERSGRGGGAGDDSRWLRRREAG